MKMTIFSVDIIVAKDRNVNTNTTNIYLHVNNELMKQDRVKIGYEMKYQMVIELMDPNNPTDNLDANYRQ